MSPRAGAPFRLELARRSLASAHDNISRGNWRDSALFARAAVEHAAKAIVACFGAVPRSHEPAQVLAIAREEERFPAALRSRVDAVLPDLAGLGAREHTLLSYGDEEHGIDPWSLVDERRAQSHLRVADAMAAIAIDCIRLTQP